MKAIQKFLLMMLVLLMGTGVTSCEFFNDNPVSPRLKVRVSSMTIQVGASRKCNVSASTRARLLYASNNESIATVDDKGIVTGISEGDAVITVVATNKEGTELFFDESAVISVKVVAKDSKADEDDAGDDSGDSGGLTTEELTPEQIAETKAQLTAVQQEGATLGITFSYQGVDYNASFEKAQGEDYKLVAFTSSKTSTLEETLKLAAFTPYLTITIPDSWTSEQIDNYLDTLNEDEADDAGDDEGDDDEGDDEGDGEEIDDDADWTDYIEINFDDAGNEIPSGARRNARNATRSGDGSSDPLDFIFGLRTADDTDLIQVQISTAKATAIIVGDTDHFTLKSVNNSGAARAATRASDSDSSMTLTFKVKKKGEKKISSVKLNYKTLSIKEVKAVSLLATVSPREAKIGKIVWEVTDKTVAHISRNGTYGVHVAPNANGSCSVIVKIDGATAMCRVTFAIQISNVELNKTSLELIEGETGQLTATVNPKGYVSSQVTWSSSDKKVATVDANGKVTAVGVGKTTIKAASKENRDKYGTCKVTVKERPLKNMTVSAEGYSGTFDGNAHGITVNVKKPNTGATVKYGEKEGSYNRGKSPTYKEVGTYTVYYQVTCDGYKPYTGKAKVEIKEANGMEDYNVEDSDKW